MKKVKEFITDAIDELKKVSWPSKEDVQNSTIVIIIVTLILAIFLGAVDKIITIVMRMLIK